MEDDLSLCDVVVAVVTMVMRGLTKPLLIRTPTELFITVGVVAGFNPDRWRERRLL